MTQPPSGEWPRAQQTGGSRALVVAAAAAGLELGSSSFVAAFAHSEGGYKAFEVILLLIAILAAVSAALPWWRARNSADAALSADVVAAAVAAFVVVFGLLQFIATLKGPRLFF
jgi:hypothetical protein